MAPLRPPAPASRRSRRTRRRDLQSQPDVLARHDRHCVRSPRLAAVPARPWRDRARKAVLRGDEACNRRPVGDRGVVGPAASGGARTSHCEDADGELVPPSIPPRCAMRRRVGARVPAGPQPPQRTGDPAHAPLGRANVARGPAVASYAHGMTAHVMDAANAHRIVSALEGVGIDASVSGGWAIDALLGEQTRLHSDLDLWVAAEDLELLIKAFVQLGLDRLFPWPGDRPWNFVVHDGGKLRVDL